MKLIDVINSPWAIRPEKLNEIIDIYSTHLRGEKIDVKAIEARLGESLNGNDKAFEIRNGVAIIPVEGVMAKRMNMFMKFSGGTSTEILGQQIDEALANPEVTAIILDVDSPGGAVKGTQELANKIFNARGEKPIVALANGMMASAALWVGSAAEQVFVSAKSAQVGSIGVVAQHVDISRSEEMVGVKTTEITSGKFKRAASEFGPLTDFGRETIKDHLDAIYTEFVQDVARFRGVSEDAVIEKMADGRMFTGQQAIQVGLVDGVSTLDELVMKLSDGGGGSLGDNQTNATNDQGVFAMNDITKKQETQAITVETVRAVHPEVFEAIKKQGYEEGVAQGRELGASSERERIKAVEDQLMTGHEDLIKTLKYDGKCTGEQAAVQILKAHKEKMGNKLQALQEDSPSAIPPSEEGPKQKKGAVDPSLPVEERAKLEWENDESIRADFGGFEEYKAWKVAEEAGMIKRRK